MLFQREDRYKCLNLVLDTPTITVAWFCLVINISFAIINMHSVKDALYGTALLSVYFLIVFCIRMACTFAKD